MQERRRTARRRTLFRGSVVFNQHRSTLDCMLRNLSEGGARLVFGDLATVPEEFELHGQALPGARKAKVAWRTHDELGIAFTR